VPPRDDVSEPALDFDPDDFDPDDGDPIGRDPAVAAASGCGTAQGPGDAVCRHATLPGGAPRAAGEPHSEPEHRHAYALPDDRRRLAAALALATSYMAAEALGGWWSGSLALLADAGHMLSDALALGLSLLAAWIARRPASSQQTYGFVRAEILAAAANGLLLVAVATGIAWEAWERFSQRPEIHLPLMASIAAGGLVVNLLMLRLLHGGHAHSLNLRGAWLHAAADTLGSVGVLLAAGGIALGWTWADPAVSLLIAALVVHSAWRLLIDAVSVLMEHSPASIEVEQVRRLLLDAPGVVDVHCLHVWSIASGYHAISAHVVLSGEHNGAAELTRLRSRLQQAFRVDHVTLQLEPSSFAGCDESPVAGCRTAMR